MMVYAFVNATSPTWGPLAEQLHFSDATLTNTYAIGCATLALGAPMLIPFALKFGARPVYLVSSVGQFAISIWAAKTENAADWWGVNATQCWLGALAEVLVQMTIADVFFVHQRGKMNAIYIWVLNVGMYLAIVAAGFVVGVKHVRPVLSPKTNDPLQTVDQGWRWVWWWFTIFFGLQAIMFFFGFEETKYSHVETLADRQGSITAETPLDDIAGGYGSEKHEKSRVNESAAKTESGDVGSPLASQAATKLGEIHIDPTIPRKTYRQKLAFTTTSPGTWSQFLRHSYQPFMILVTIPGVTFCALVYGVNQAWSTVMTASQNTILLDPPYNFSASDIGLMSLGPCVYPLPYPSPKCRILTSPVVIGSTIGSLVSGPVSDYVAIRLAKANDGVYEPEFRFWVFLPFCPFMLGGAWWFGYALQNGWHWAQVVVAFGMFGFGAAPVQAISLTYMLDAYNGKPSAKRIPLPCDIC